MKKIVMNGTDLSVSNICYGTGNFKEKLSREDAFEMLNFFLREGGNFIDTANVYCRWLPDTGNCAEQYLGEWFRRNGNRDRVVLATKGGHPHLRTGANRVNKKDLTSDLNESLATMGVEYVDFYWLHRDNTDLPIEEVIDIAEGFVREGKVRYYGASNFTQSRMEQAAEWQENHPGKGFRALCNQWSLAYPNPGYKLNGDQTLEGIDSVYYHWIREKKIPLIPYSATAGGFYGKIASRSLSPVLEKAYINPRNLEIDELLRHMAKAYHTTPLVLSLAILLNQGFQVIPVTAVSRRAQLEESLKASELRLSDTDTALLNNYF